MAQVRNAIDITVSSWREKFHALLGAVQMLFASALLDVFLSCTAQLMFAAHSNCFLLVGPFDAQWLLGLLGTSHVV